MDMLPRILAQTIKKNQKAGFINLIYGPRRVGKTVLLQQLAQRVPAEKIIWFDGDTQEAQEALSTTSQVTLARLVEEASFVVIDEAQRISNIGLSLKILIDRFPKKVFYVTGSSSLILSRGIQEPLTGRTSIYRLFPLSASELTADLSAYQKKALLEEQLRFGGYPYLQQAVSLKDKQIYLKSLVSDYLFKDVLALKDIASPENLKKLATLLAFQIGQEVSLNELANSLGIDIKTVRRYLSLLKQSFVIFELGAFAKNLRKEVVKSKKYFFWDLGIRNALTDQFLPLDSRTDVGQLWENFLAVERLKKHEYQRILTQYFFWRTYEQAEIDWLEVKAGRVAAYEFKWQGAKSHTPKAFKEAYQTSVKWITKENYLDFIL